MIRLLLILCCCPVFLAVAAVDADGSNQPLEQLVSRTLTSGGSQGVQQNQLLQWREEGLRRWARAPSAGARLLLQQQMQDLGLLPVLAVWNPAFDQTKLVLPQPLPLTKPPLLTQSNVSTPTLVHFWAHWCGPCRRELQELNAFYRNHAVALQRHGLQLMTINADPELTTAARALAGRLPIQHDPDFVLYRRLMQPAEAAATGSEAPVVVGLPLTLLLRPQAPPALLAHGVMRWQAELVLAKVSRLLVVPDAVTAGAAL